MIAIIVMINIIVTVIVTVVILHNKNKLVIVVLVEIRCWVVLHCAQVYKRMENATQGYGA